MIEFTHILCPIDFSDFSRRALDHAIGIARLYGSTITALHVFATLPDAVPFGRPDPLPPVGLTDDERSRLLDKMRDFTASEAGSQVRIELALAETSLVDRAIIDEADARKADLIVIGTHGRSGFQHLMLGSVTEKLLRKTKTPVLTVPRGVPEAVPVGPHLYKQILCGVDFSECSLQALSQAVSLATRLHGQLTVVNIIELLPEISEPLGPGPFYFEGVQESLEEDAAKRFKELIPDSTRQACQVEEVIVVGKPYREILRLAAERHTELIALGVHGRGALDRMLFGSTTHHVVREATCPVLTFCSR